LIIMLERSPETAVAARVQPRVPSLEGLRAPLFWFVSLHAVPLMVLIIIG
jgi:hypothetical protein